jgi:hypothetical protein
MARLFRSCGRIASLNFSNFTVFVLSAKVKTAADRAEEERRVVLPSTTDISF